jgi:site-specific DNA-methyltransferase (adenine-specific)
MLHRLYYGDCFSLIKRHLGPETVDLVYLDPPWKKKRSVNVLHRERDGTESAASVEVFDLTWRWGYGTSIALQELMDAGGAVADTLDGLQRIYSRGRDPNTFAYFVRMAQVLLEARRVMKAGASLYLHCDVSFSAPLRHLGDAVFPDGFRSEIIRTYRRMPTKTSNYQHAHETLYYYCKGPEPKTFNLEFCRPSYATMRRMKGKKQYLAPGATKKVLLDEPARPPLRDVWPFAIIPGRAKEYVPGFATQKPLKLLQRIIRISSNPGDLVLDPFCGSGVTLYAAHGLGRGSVCMDITHVAIERIRERLAAGPEYQGIQYSVHGDPVDLMSARALAAHDKDQWQDWAAYMLGATGVHKKGADGGVDDLLRFRDGDATHTVIISVKGGKTSGAHVDALGGVLQQHGAAIGILAIVDAPTPDMRTRAARLGAWVASDGRRYPKIQIFTAADLVARRRIEMPVPMPPREAPQRYHDLAEQTLLAF